MDHKTLSFIIADTKNLKVASIFKMNAKHTPPVIHAAFIQDRTFDVNLP